MSETDWYLLDRGGRRYGPYDRELVEQLAAQRELQAATPVWHPGLARWQPAGRVLMLPRSERSEASPAVPIRPARTPPPAPRPVAKPSAPATKPPGPASARAATATATARLPATPMTRPQATRRVLAALLDLACLAVAFRLFSGVFPATATEALRRAPSFLLLWAALDAAATVRLGCTPGKALMGIRVTGPEERKLSWPRALLRSGALPLLCLLLWLRSGFTIFVAALALVLTVRRMRSGFAPWWDDMVGARVSYGSPGPRLASRKTGT